MLFLQVFEKTVMDPRRAVQGQLSEEHSLALFTQSSTTTSNLDGVEEAMIVIDNRYRSQACEEVVDMMEANPNLLVMHGALYPVRYQRDIRLYAYPSKSPTYWFLLINQKGATPMVVAAQQGDSYDRATFLNALKLFLDETQLLKKEISIEFGTEAHMMHEITTYLVQSKGRQPGIRREHYVFFMTSDQIENAQKLEHSLPYGYELSDLTTEDAEEIQRSSENKEPLETFRKRIEWLPSSCIRQSSTGRVVSHELRSHYGAMVDQYTVPEHRRQGLGQAVEMALAQKIIRANEVPFKLVPTYLTSIVYSSQESTFWTMWSRNSFPVPYVIQKFEKST
ncbi:FR47 domain-containing protein [Trichostrongylus colubriformis]|uniref:FR47 domain-containing protein n=1 Tax=Trichostrongylus colubriformis TaxID=6319 RepID=A0AAN8EXU8_TRICO